MLNLARTMRVNGAAQRLFSTSARRSHDVAKLTLIGRLGREPETKYTASNKEYVTYTVATTNYPPPPPNPDGSRPSARTSWHYIYCFAPNIFDYLRTLTKGSHVYVEANYELREPDASAEPGSPQGQRQIFLRHETLRLLGARRQQPESEGETEVEN
ncbi:RIM1 [Sanghuangporus weigelae]